MENYERIKAAFIKTFTKIAGETIDFDIIDGIYYAFGSELATLRIYKHYNDCYYNDCKCDQGYSTNLGKFYCSIDLNNK